MDLLIAANSVPLADADTAPGTGTPQYATSGNPATNTPATSFPAYHYNMLMQELLALLTAADITPSTTNNGQVLAAVQALIAAGAPAETGRLINIQQFTSSGTYTPTSGMSTCIVEMVAGGSGGGGAAATTSGECSAGGPGFSSPQAVGRFTAAQVGASQAVTIGAAGTAGSAGQNTGGTGGTTSFGSLMSVTGYSGGLGGPICTASEVYLNGGGTSGGATSGTNLEPISEGSGFQWGFAFYGQLAVQAAGQGSPYGAVSFSSPVTSGSLAGDAASGPGAGGGGGATCDGSAVAGGAGGKGFCRVWEFS